MELALSLGDASKPFKFLDKSPKMVSSKDLEFCMALGSSGLSSGSGRSSDNKGEASDDGNCSRVKEINGCDERRGSTDPPLQLDLLPLAPAVPRTSQPPTNQRFRLPWFAGNFTGGSEPEAVEVPVRGLDVNRLPVAGRVQEEEADDGAAQSSPNSAMSAFQVDFGIRSGGIKNKRDVECDNERDCSRGSDDDENGLTRKKLRLSKEQSAFLEESFKEHSTLNPKQKLALAKQLNLRPRQVEVWFQNRRARTKLKQTEIDCEYLKRCCETLTEENRRLQKELQELRALKTSQPFFMQLPATTLTMCPSCERVATTSTTASASASAATNSIAAANPATTATSSALPLSLAKPRGYPFSPAQVHMPQTQSQAQAHQATS